MMKKLLSLLTATVMILSLCLCFSAATTPYFTDDASLFSTTEARDIQTLLTNFRSEYDFDIVVFTEYRDISDSDTVDYADMYYEKGGFNNDGVLLYINMETRYVYISTSGYGITAFTEYGIDEAVSQVKGYLGDEDYYLAVSSFITTTGEYVTAARDGHPVEAGKLIPCIIAVTICFLIAFIVVTIMKKSMNTAVRNNSAVNYVREGSFNLTNQQDLFLYTTSVRTKIESNSSNGGTHTSSGGGSHGGGGGHF